MNASFTSLIEKHLNATLTTAEAAQLAQAMADDPTVAEHFASLTRLDAELAASTKEGGRTALYTRRMERAVAETAPLRDRRRWSVKTMTAAAGLAVLIGAGWGVLEGSGPGRVFAQKSKSGSVKETSGEGASVASLAGNSPAMESAAMKRMLRRFFVPAMNVRRQPVSGALTALQQQWKDGSSEGSKETAPVAFTIADSVRHRWQKPEDEPLVSLEIPGISLLTNLELVAAQSGLKAVITGHGVSLEEDPRASDEKVRTWSIPLAPAVLTTFMKKAGAGLSGVQNQFVQDNFDVGFSLLDVSRQMGPSWMGETQRVAVVNVNTQQPVTWNDYGLLWIVAPTEQVRSSSWGPNQPVEAGDLLASIASEEFAAAQTAFALTGVPTDPPNAENLRFSPDGKQLMTAGADGTAKIWDAATGKPVAPALSYADYVGDGYTIDLDIAPGVVELDGFINDGSPIQTNAIDALVQSEPVVLTDSGIIKPVFRMTGSDDPANLSRLLAAHGMPAAGATWDPETGVLTARGTMQNLRAAHAAAAAIEESATAGVSVDMRVIEWKEGQAPAVDPDMILPPAEAAMILSANEAAALLRLPNTSVTSSPRVRAAIGAPVSFHQMTDKPVPEGESVPDDYKAWINASLSPIKRLAGDTFAVPVSVERSAISGYETKDGVRSPVRSTQKHESPCKLQDGAWLRIDFPAEGDAHATTALLNIQSVDVRPD